MGQNHDFIRVLYGADALGHNELCGVVKFIFQGPSQLSVCFIVQSGEGVVKNQNLRFSGQRAGDGYSLLLAAGQIASADLDLFAQLFRHTLHKFGSLGDVQGLPCVLFRHGGVALAEIHVFLHGAGEQHGLLCHIAQFIVQGFEAVFPDILAVQEHLALCGVKEAGGQADKRGLAAAGGADKGHGLSPPGLKADILQHGVAAVRVLEGHIAKFQGTPLCPLFPFAFFDSGFGL